jgi:putative ABC transport system permease protein
MSRARHLDVFAASLAQRLDHKARTFLTVCGITFGVLGLTVMSAIISGVNRQVEAVVGRKLGVGVFVVKREPGELASYAEWRKYRRRPPVTLAELDRLRPLVTVAGRSGAMASRVGSVKLGRREVEGVEIRGVSEEISRILAIELERGRWFLGGEVHGKQKVCVLGWDAARALFGSADPIGRRVALFGERFTVVAVARREGEILGASQDSWVAIPLGVLSARLDRGASLTLVFQVDDAGRMGLAMDEVRARLRSVRGLTPGQPDDFTVESAADFVERWSAISGTAATFALAVSSIALLVGGLVVMNVVLVDVGLRRKELGIRRAVGATRGDILLQIMAESAGLTGVGGLLGLAIGLVVARSLSLFSPVPAALMLGDLLRAMGVALAVGLVAGLWPAWRAVRLDPIEVIRRES